MTNKNRIIILSATVCICIVLWGATIHSPSSAARIGFIDMDMVFKQYDKWNDISRYLEDREKMHQAEAEKLAEKIHKLQTTLDQTPVADPAYEKTQTEIIEKKTYLETLLQQYEKELRETEITRYESVWDEIELFVKQVAKENSLSAVFQKSLELPEGYWKSVLYCKTELDITGMTVSRLNREYKDNK